jgi:hypothetical protein
MGASLARNCHVITSLERALLAVLVGMTSGASNEDTDKAFGVFCRAYVSLNLAYICKLTQITLRSCQVLAYGVHANKR